MAQTHPDDEFVVPHVSRSHVGLRLRSRCSSTSRSRRNKTNFVARAPRAVCIPVALTGRTLPFTGLLASLDYSLPTTRCPTPLCFHTLTNHFPATPLFSHPCKTPRGCVTCHPLCFLAIRDESRATSHKSRPFILLEPLCGLFARFSALVSFVFNRLQPLFRKQPGWHTLPPRILRTIRSTA
jgi:hypothetical protein